MAATALAIFDACKVVVVLPIYGSVSGPAHQEYRILLVVEPVYATTQPGFGKFVSLALGPPTDHIRKQLVLGSATHTDDQFIWAVPFQILDDLELVDQFDCVTPGNRVL